MQGLNALLSAAAPSTPTEHAHRDAMLDLAASQGSWRRDHFTPGHFTASAFVLSPNLKQLLLIHHGKLLRWLQPGGHVDPEDRDLESAARREVSEEVGLFELERLDPAPFDLDVHPIPARKSEPTHQHFDVRFLFRSPTLEVVAGSDALDARWVDLHAVSALESDASVLRAVDKITARR